MRKRLGYLALFSIIGAGLLWSYNATTRAAQGKKDVLHARIFEMRTYHTAPGRLPVLHKRFREHTNYLFVKHGMTLIGYWTPVDKEDTLVYILAYPSKEAREKSWKAFMADKEWQRVWKESKKDGPVVVKVEQQFLSPTDYSPIR